MSSLANDLLNDFEESGSENGEDFGPLQQEDNDIRNSDGDNEEGNPDPALGEDKDRMRLDSQDEDDTKAKVEKMKLGDVSDVRSVAGLMKMLQPVLEVSTDFRLYLSPSRFTALSKQS